MRKIIKIAGNELRALFYSPIAWFILIAFVLQVSSVFLGIVRGFARAGTFGEPIEYSLTSAALSGMFGLFTGIQQNLYFYFPLLTMGLMSRELSSGSIKLLYSSPVSASQIVIGKYLSMMAYGLVMIGLIFLYVLFFAATIPHFDSSMAFAGLLGLYLLACAYAAIGLFMSSLTSYQIVAAMGTLAALAFLNFVGSIGQGIDFIRDITYWLSINGRATVFVEGLLCSEEFCYFVLVIFLFIMLTVMKVESHRAKRRGMVAVGRYMGVVVLTMILGYLTSRPSMLLYKDMTARKSQTISDESRRVVEKMDGKLTITAYVNLLGDNYNYGLPKNTNSNLRHFKSYIRFKPDIKMDYVYYYHKVREAPRGMEGLTDRELAERILKSSKSRVGKMVSLDELPNPQEIKEEGYRFFWKLTREEGQSTHLRLFQDMMVFPTENETSAAMKRLVTESPRVAFLTGHGERDSRNVGDRDYYAFARNQTFRYALLNQGFDIWTYELVKQEEIPSDIKVLVIADARTPFLPGEIEKIERFVENGGNLLIAGEPGRQEVMNPLVSIFGVRFMDGLLLQPSEDFSADLLVCEIAEEGASITRELASLRKKNRHIVLPGGTGLIYEEKNGFRVLPLLSTPDTGSWNRTCPVDPVHDVVTLNTAIGEVERAYPTALALSRQQNGKEQRIILLGDADCFSNAELMMQREGIQAYNFSLITESFRWLSDGAFPVDTKRPDPEDTSVLLKLRSLKWVRWGFLGILPCCLLGGFLSVQLKRRRN